MGLSIHIQFTPAQGVLTPESSGAAGMTAGHWTVSMRQYTVSASFTWAADPPHGIPRFDRDRFGGTGAWIVPLPGPDSAVQRMRFGLVQNSRQFRLEAKWGRDWQVLAEDDQQRLDTVAEADRPFVHDSFIRRFSALPAVLRVEAGVELHVYGRGGLSRTLDPWYAEGRPAVAGNPMSDAFHVVYADEPVSAVPTRCVWDQAGQTRGGDLRAVRDLLTVQLWFIAEYNGQVIPLVFSEPFTLFSSLRLFPLVRGRSIMGPERRDNYDAAVLGVIDPERFPESSEGFSRSRLARSPARIPFHAFRSGADAPVVSGETANELMRRQFARSSCGIEFQRQMDVYRRQLIAAP